MMKLKDTEQSKALTRAYNSVLKSGATLQQATCDWLPIAYNKLKTDDKLAMSDLVKNLSDVFATCEGLSEATPALKTRARNLLRLPCVVALIEECNMTITTRSKKTGAKEEAQEEAQEVNKNLIHFEIDIDNTLNQATKMAMLLDFVREASKQLGLEEHKTTSAVQLLS